MPSPYNARASPASAPSAPAATFRPLLKKPAAADDADARREMKATQERKKNSRKVLELNAVVVCVELETPCQEMHSFGCCDSYGVEVVGRWPDTRMRERVAQLLFDSRLDDVGHPCGIGLSGWRCRLGAGSLGTGECEERLRMDTYLEEDWHIYGLDDERSYDFSRCEGQRWFLHAARRHGVSMFTATAHAPPAPLTGCAQNPHFCSLWAPDDSALLCTEYALYLARVIKHFDSQGIFFSSLSPARAVHSGGGPQEGCLYTNQEYLAMISSVDQELRRLNLSTRLAGPDAVSVDFLTSSIPGQERHSDFLRFFFESARAAPDATGAVASFPARFSVVSAASYLSCWPEGDRLLASRESLRAQAMKYMLAHPNGIEYWVSEYTVRVPSGDARIPKAVVERVQSMKTRAEAGEKRGQMDVALHAARVIIADLVVCSASSWNWGEAVSTEHTTDGLLEVDSDDPSSMRATKMLWVLGQFSFFVRPGYTRVATTRGNDSQFRDHEQTGVLTAAFLDDTGAAFVVVIVNLSEADRNVQMAVSGAEKVVPQMCCYSSYLTSETASLSYYRAGCLGDFLLCPARSVVTVRGDLIQEGVAYVLGSCCSSRHALVIEVDDQDKGVAALGEESSPPDDADAGRGANYPIEPQYLRTRRRARQLWKIMALEDGECVMVQSDFSGVVLTAPEELPAESLRTAMAVHYALPSSVPSIAERQRFKVRRSAAGDFVLLNVYAQRAVECYGDTLRFCVPNGKRTQHWGVRPAAEAAPAGPGRQGRPQRQKLSEEERRRIIERRATAQTPALFDNNGPLALAAGGGADQRQQQPPQHVQDLLRLQQPQQLQQSQAAAGLVDIRQQGPSASLGGPTRRNKFSHKDFFKSQAASRVTEEIPVKTSVPIYKNPRYAASAKRTYPGDDEPDAPYVSVPPYVLDEEAASERRGHRSAHHTLSPPSHRPQTMAAATSPLGQHRRAHPGVGGGGSGAPAGRRGTYLPAASEWTSSTDPAMQASGGAGAGGKVLPSTGPPATASPPPFSPLSRRRVGGGVPPSSSSYLNSSFQQRPPPQQQHATSTRVSPEEMMSFTPGVSQEEDGVSMLRSAYLTVTQGELARMSAVNEELRQRREEESERQHNDVRDRRIREEAAKKAAEEADQREKEEAERGKRRGTSHLVLTLQMTKAEFSVAFQKAFRATVAKKLGLIVWRRFS